MKIIEYNRQDDQTTLHTDHGLVGIQVMASNIFRVRYTLENQFAKSQSLIIVPQEKIHSDFKIKENSQSLHITTEDILLEINKSTSAFRWLDQFDHLLVREPAQGGKTLTEVQVDNTGQPPTKQSRKAYATRLAFEFSAGEAIYGLGQHEEGILNYRGHCQYLYQNNMKIAMPMLVSTRGYGILFDSYSLGIFHDDQYGSYYWSDTEDEMDYYFIYGPSFDRIIAGMRTLTGRVPMLPRWAYGFAQSKERYKDQQELIDIVRQYRKRRIPLDTVIQDWQYWDEGDWGQKGFDSERFPDPKGMMDELHTLNAHAMISVWPNFVDVPHKKPFVERNLLLPDDNFYNVFEPEARALQWQQMNEGIFQHGMDGWWCDSTEPYDGQFFYDARFRPEPWERVQLNRAEFVKHIDPEFINVYSLLNSQGVYEGQRSTTDEKRMVNLTRSAFPGQQRYSTIVWSGDTAANWETLRWHIPGGLNTTVTGFPNWTLDIGAFFVRDHRQERWWYAGDYPQGTDDLGYRELYVRWLQYAVFLPMFRAHGTDIDRELFRFGKPGEVFYDTLVKFDILRYRLLPYIYSLAAWESHRHYTMLRLLAFDFPDDPLTYNVKDQFMFGPAFLVCPVTEPMYYAPTSKNLDGVPKMRRVYLPEGCDWYDFWTGERHQGGQEITAQAPLQILPLFVKAGSILPMGPVVQHSHELLDAPLEARVYPGADGEFDFYEDEGDGYRYERGAFAWTKLRWDDEQDRFTVLDRHGNYPGMPENRQFNLVIVRENYGVGVNEMSFTAPLQIESALQSAQSSGKRVLLVFSAMWCPDCVVLENLLKNNTVEPFLETHFITVKIDVNNRYRNQDIVEKYGNPTAKGIPAVVVLDANGKILHSTKQGELARARDASPEEILGYLRTWGDE